MLILPLVVSCTKPDDGGGTTNPTDPETPVTPITPIDPVNPSEPTEVWGVYNPGKKIKMIYESDSRYQKWTWNGDLLESIKYCYSDGDIDDVQFFIYEGQRVVRIEYRDYGGYNGYVDFEYDGNLLKSANLVLGESNLYQYYFLYQGSTLSKIVIKSDNNEDYSFQFTWNDGNISKVSEDNDEVDAYLSYDDRINPFKGLFSFNELIQPEDYFGIGRNGPFFSNHNVTQIYWSGHGGDTYEYQYDKDGYPTMRKENGVSYEIFEYE